jgi:hypothetical protein
MSARDYSLLCLGGLVQAEKRRSLSNVHNKMRAEVMNIAPTETKLPLSAPPQ